MGFKYKYTMEDMFDQAIQTCREMKLIPLRTEDETKEQSHNGSIKPTPDSVWCSIASKKKIMPSLRWFYLDVLDGFGVLCTLLRASVLTSSLCTD